MRLVLSLVVLLAALAALPFAVAQDTVARSTTAQAQAPRDAQRAADDPRVCLEFPTNEQVIACAEKYRPRRRG